MQNAIAISTDLNQWCTFNQFPELHPNFTKPQIEWLYRNRKSNGFSKAFQKIGKLRYIHVGIFADCLISKAVDSELT